ncbi:hypothetical protein C9374_005469 [Naegleria lovaniensis]|uniref:Tubulin/FtsZ GTPase domain-containing protein n=1 Tax=Naegleria lovaniensis TaxID=51637 RepID=A0AA88GQ03_NAELO|nr:uncharacterized protein C9374_005469 [Naegleria lovaniensis]KAG2382267.1 hypothetical protein C9374_005469 [Naegleria lovaniensis]
MKEILSLNFGQAGCQIGNSNYHLFAQEYGMMIPCRDHHKDSHHQHQHQQPQQQQEELFMDERYYKVLYEEWDPGSGSDHHSSSMQSYYYYTPRSLFMDLDSSNLDSIRVRNRQSSSNAVHYRPDSFIGGQEDASSVCTRAKYSMGRILLDSCMESIRKYLERCDRLDSLWIHAGLGGGSGSGLTSLIMEQLGCDLNKVTKIFIPVMPSPQRSNVIVEPYNVVLGLKDLHDKVDASIVLDNEALYHYVSHWKNEVVGVGIGGIGGEELIIHN